MIKSQLKPPLKPKIAKNPELGQNVPKNIKKEDFMQQMSEECPILFSQANSAFRAFSYNTDISKFKKIMVAGTHSVISMEQSDHNNPLSELAYEDYKNIEGRRTSIPHIPA